MLCAAPRPSFLTANLSTVYGISIRQESTSRQHTHTHTHTSAVPEHGPTLTGPTPSLELTASHEPKENKFYQTAIAIRMNSLKDIFFWFLDFFVNVVFFFLLDSWAFKTVMFFCTAKRRNAHWSPKPSEFSMANSNDCSLEMIPRHKTVPVFRPIL